MAFSAYDRVNFAQFNPLSAQELMMPAQALAQQHTQLEDQFVEQQDKAASLRSMLLEGVDKEAIDKYNKFDNTISSAVDSLTNKGVVDGATRANLIAAKRQYSSELSPIQSSAVARNQAAQQLKQMKMQDNSIEYVNPYTISVMQGAKDPSSYMTTAISGRKIAQEVSMQAQALAKQSSIPPSIMAIPGFKFKYMTSLGTGATLEDVLKASTANNDKATQKAVVQAMSGIVDNTLKANGVYDTFGEQSPQTEKLRAFANEGLYSAIGSTTYGYMDDDYAKSSALMNQKASLDKAEIDYRAKKAAEVEALKNRQQGQLFDYGYSKPTVNGSKKEMPKNFDAMFSRDGRGTLLKDSKTNGIKLISSPGTAGALGSVYISGSGSSSSSNNEYAGIIKSMRSKYGNQRDSRGVPIKSLTDKQIMELYYSQNNAGGFASSTLKLRDDSHTFGNNETLNDPYSVTRDMGALYINNKELENLGDKNRTANNYAEQLGFDNAEKMQKVLGKSKYQWNIGVSKNGEPVYETEINGHLVQKAMNSSQRAVFEPFAKISKYDETNDFINSKPMQFTTDNGIQFHVDKNINGLNIKYRTRGSNWESTTPEEILEMTESRSLSRGFVTKVNYQEDK